MDLVETKREAFVPNVVAGGLLGLCPLVAASDSFADGAVLGLGVALSVLVLGFALAALKNRIPQRLRYPLVFVFEALFSALYTVAIRTYSPLLASGLDIYLPLLASNCVLSASLYRALRNEKTATSALFPSALGYLGAALVLSLIREVLGLGSLSLPTPGALLVLRFTEVPPMRLLAAPAGGFMLLGAFAALYRLFLRLAGRRIP